VTDLLPGGHPGEMMRIGRSKRAAQAVPAFVIIFGCGPGEPYASEAEQRAPKGWLGPCEGDTDCPAPGECVHGLCTLRCDVTTLETCATLSIDAVCDTHLGACDVPCGVALACEVLAPGYTCEEDRCRVPGATVSSSRTDARASSRDEE
jgi:hypothetical protein